VALPALGMARRWFSAASLITIHFSHVVGKGQKQFSLRACDNLYCRYSMRNRASCSVSRDFDYTQSYEGNLLYEGLRGALIETAQVMRRPEAIESRR
jgi:hypothetical protein